MNGNVESSAAWFCIRQPSGNGVKPAKDNTIKPITWCMARGGRTREKRGVAIPG